MILVGLESFFNLLACMFIIFFILSSVGFYFIYTRFLWYKDFFLAAHEDPEGADVLPTSAVVVEGDASRSS